MLGFPRCCCCDEDVGADCDFVLVDQNVEDLGRSDPPRICCILEMLLLIVLGLELGLMWYVSSLLDGTSAGLSPPNTLTPTPRNEA